MQEVLRMVEDGSVDAVCIAKLDRITRSVRDLDELLQRFAKNNVALICYEGDVDTSTASGRMVLNLLTTVAQWERETIAERTKAALQHLKSNGKAAGHAPYGWRAQPREVLANGKKAPQLPLKKDPLEQAVINDIRMMRSSGKTLAGIAATFQRVGVKTQSGGAWCKQDVARILKANP
jgi:DNA invertase Pin-like site-specific DNA recombinase